MWSLPSASSGSDSVVVVKGGGVGADMPAAEESPSSMWYGHSLGMVSSSAAVRRSRDAGWK